MLLLNLILDVLVKKRACRLASGMVDFEQKGWQNLINFWGGYFRSNFSMNFVEQYKIAQRITYFERKLR